MEWFEQIPFLTLAIAALIRVGIGSFWYSPFLFGEIWMKENHFTEHHLKHGLPMWKLTVGSYLLSYCLAFGIYLLVRSVDNVLIAMATSISMSLIFSGATRLNSLLFEKSSFRLFLLHTGYDLVSFILMAFLIIWKGF